MESAQRRHHRFRLHTGNRAHRDGGDRVVQHVHTGQLHGGHRHHPVFAGRRPADDPVAARDESLGDSARRRKPDAVVHACCRCAPSRLDRRHSPRPSRRQSGSRRPAPWPPRTTRRRDGDRDGRRQSSATAQSTAGRSSSFRAGSCSSRSRARIAVSTHPPARSAEPRCCRRRAPGGRPPTASGQSAWSSSTCPSFQ